jgi:mannose-6-phosphate isomerase-like protein (cupin superfamily)
VREKTSIPDPFYCFKRTGHCAAAPSGSGVDSGGRASGYFSAAMDDFPEFMKSPANKVALGNQFTPGIEGYVFDGADGSQMAFWTCHEAAVSTAHAHEYDEYLAVVQGCYTLVIDGKRIPVKAGEEYLIPRGVLHGGEAPAGTRTIHAFGGHRADRQQAVR